ncbi:ImmA/IrrE family metallo-endopeptidase [Chitinophaga cymbidii]|nr:ImmA/IrrE family metallo-endopeptidase [Chitinophaga cymbidii]
MAKKNAYFPQSVPHPGTDLAEKLEEWGMGPKEFAIRTGKPEKTITAILKGESSITPDMAVQFENVTRVPAHFWLNRQRNFDECNARERQRETLVQSIGWAKQFPVSEMVKKGWLPDVITWEEKTAVLLAFFGFSNHHAWEDYYFRQQLKVSFRISLVQTTAPFAISAWLRKGELQAAELSSKPYSAAAFKEALPELKKIMASHPATFFDQLQAICQEAGVKVVHTPCLPKTPISGATRWLNNTPLIQLTGRYKRNDSFWFTFFHEAGHILLHGKKDIFLEDVEYEKRKVTEDAEMKEKEQEADEFAVKWTFSEDEEAEVLAVAPISEQHIRRFAKKFGTHPAIITGRLQHKGIVPYTFGKQYFQAVDFA